jgi:hypothetical protein
LIVAALFRNAISISKEADCSEVIIKAFPCLIILIGHGNIYVSYELFNAVKDHISSFHYFYNYISLNFIKYSALLKQCKKKTQSLTHTQVEHYESLLACLAEKMKFTDQYLFEKRTENEEFFDNYRNEIVKIFTSMAHLESGRFMSFVEVSTGLAGRFYYFFKKFIYKQVVKFI